jgi:hypothetical protein
MTYRTEQDAVDARRLVDEARARVRSSLLDNVRTASPCAASWDDMVGDHQVRRCGGCNKDVFNLSHMTREDAERLIQATSGKLCARYYRRADCTILTADCSVGAGAARRRKLVVAGTTLMIAVAGVLAYERTTHADAEAPDVQVAVAAEELVPVVRAQAAEADAPPEPPRTSHTAPPVPHVHLAARAKPPVFVDLATPEEVSGPWQGDVDVAQ